jgi:phospholipid/cholesterol/gamma-HCH transport system substrate-binding protein
MFEVGRRIRIGLQTIERRMSSRGVLMQRRLKLTGILGLTLVLLIAGAGAAAGLIQLAANQGWFESKARFEFAVRSAEGARPGTRVRILGVPSGRITSVQAPTTVGEPVVIEFELEGSRADLLRRDATARIIKDGLVGERVVEIDPGSPTAARAPESHRLTAAESPSLEETLARLDEMLADAQAGKGTLGRLLTDESLFVEANRALREAGDVAGSVRESYAGLKDHWAVGGLMKDRYELLIRPQLTTYRRSFAESELFEPGRAVLTDSGLTRVDELVDWVRGFDSSNGELLVAGFLLDEKDGRLADVTSRKQAQAVLDRLVKTHAIHRTGVFRRRKNSAHGFGNVASPDSAAPGQPRRIEVLVFAP